MPALRIKNASPSIKIKNTLPNMRLRQEGATTIIIQAGTILPIFPYIYTYATAVLVGSHGDGPTFSRQPTSV